MPNFRGFNWHRQEEETPAPESVLRVASRADEDLDAWVAPPPDPEALMPRWRRPSLKEARYTDPIRNPAPAQRRLAFAIEAVNGAAGLERREVRYSVAPLLDQPDEIRSMRIGDLAAGDEVQIEQTSGAYFLVLCPDGRRGWLHRTTLNSAPSPLRAWSVSDLEAPAEAENALAAMLTARSMHRVAS